MRKQARPAWSTVINPRLSVAAQRVDGTTTLGMVPRLVVDG
jgi:hypothetical protein